jgi:hypothetical protein
MFRLKTENFKVRDAGTEMKETKIKPNYIYEVEAMRLNAEEARLKIYTSLVE